ncbi:discoidin domain-containing protein [Paenibacillus sp. CF384]|uniref:discoidin domain-containing protein n=1 Tax=Paenibacillus sp. CF384 TaxID=1884382 RepID=UPI000897B6F8|nr:discoidin domain-containing protein [Paenibacillus sp. CF384]SDX48978.1 Endoglucanase Acf2 [Paenibacillus sp. CF384]
MSSFARKVRRKMPLTTKSVLTLSLLLGSWNGAIVAAASAKGAEASHLLTYGGAAYASSTEGGLTPEKAVDGILDSRWGSAFSADQQWIYVDLGAPAKIDKAVIRWENAYSKSYKIQVSDDEKEWKDIYTDAKGDGGVDTISLSGEGRYVRMLSLERSGGYGVSLYEFEVYGTGGTNPIPVVLGEDVAKNKPVTASSFEKADKDKPAMPPENANDGDATTRWSSAHTSNEWIYVDLGQVHEIGRIRLNWENAAGRIYDLQVSDDAANWTTIYREMNGQDGWIDTPVYASGRYVRMKGISRTTSYGYSLFNFSVYDYVNGDPKPSYTIPTLPTSSTVNVGKGSYLTSDIDMPQPRPPMNKSDELNAPIPSNDWWQSVLIKNFSDSLITLPLKSKYSTLGLGILNPGAGWVNDTGNSQAADGGPDFYLHAGNISTTNVKNKITGYGDWSATVALSDNDTPKMTTTFVKGSPYLYSEFSDPTTSELYFPVSTRFYDDNGNAVLAAEGATLTADHIGFAVTNVDGSPQANKVTRNYGVFAPEGSVFMKVGNKVKIRLGSGHNYLSVATIPATSDLNYFYKHGYAFVKNTIVTPSFEENTSEVVTNFKVEIDQKRSDLEPTTLMALLPHQWKQTDSSLTPLSYPSIRGTLKLHEGNAFTTKDQFNGIVPQFTEPGDASYSREALLEQLSYLDEATSKNIMSGDAYWQGKVLHPLAMGVLIADQIGDQAYKDVFLSRMRTILTDWYTYTKGEPDYFMYYDPTWGTMYYKNSEFGANTGLTDHHFTYGYYVFASAVLATYDQDFKDNYGGMVEHLIRDYANPSKEDPLYPFLRNFDPYEGHSWAGGYGDNNNGNNQEAAGESLFGWVGEYMWSLLSGDKATRDISIYGFTTELKAVEQYWFNYDNDNWLPEFAHKSVGQVYGSAYNFGTFFSGNPVNVYGIHWLPTGEYLTSYGFDPAKAADLYNGMVKDNKGPEDAWQHIVWPIEALSNPQAVLDKFTVENTQKNEIFNTYWFVHNMATLGTRTEDIWASGWTGASVYKKGAAYTAEVWNPTNKAITVTFHNAAGVTGSAKVGPKSLVKVDPTKVTDLDANVAPVLATDKTSNMIKQPIELTFADHLKWRESISSVQLNGAALDPSDYIVQAGKITLNSNLFPIEGSYSIVVKATDYPDTGVQQVVITNSTVNLALNKPTFTSDKPNNPGSYAVDGKLDTRWESAFSDPQYVAVNLKSEYRISHVRLNWENAAGKSYKVLVSTDGKQWKPVYSTTRGHEGIDDITFPAVNARFVKVEGTERTTNYGYSLWELEVFGTPAGSLDAPDLIADSTMNRAGQPIEIGFDDVADWRTAIQTVKVNGTAVSAAQYEVAPGKLTLDGSLFPAAGNYNIAVESNGFVMTSIQQPIVTSSNVNLALRKPTFTSSTPKQASSYAVDGNKATRWESESSDSQSIMVDLGAEDIISRVLLNWENAAGKSYTVEVSTDNKVWQTVYTTTIGKPGINDIGFSPISARYVKVNGTERTTNYGYSLWELEVYGNGNGLPSAPELSADTTNTVVGQPIEVTFGDDAAWRDAIETVSIDGTTINASTYQVNAGKIIFDASLFKSAKSYVISVQAKDYTEASVQQNVTAKEQPGNPDTNPNPDPGSNPNPLNLAFGKETASSPEYHRSSADAVDGRLDRRWESAFADNQWMSINLGSAKTINRVVLNWENAFGKAYTIDVSLDGEKWTTVYTTDNGNGGIDDISFAPVQAKFVKMNGIKRGSPYGFSLWEFEVYAGDKAPLAGPALTADTTDNTLGKPIDITFTDDIAWRTAMNAVELNGVTLREDQYTVTAGQITLHAELFTEATPYVVTVQSLGYASDSVVQPLTAGLNLALNKNTATSEGALQGGERAVDGNKGTRWESAFSDPQWINVDLGTTNTISRVLLNWENASAKAYTIEVSQDGERWTTVYATAQGDGGIDNIFIAPVEARFVKVHGTERNTQYGYSLFELEVY